MGPSEWLKRLPANAGVDETAAAMVAVDFRAETLRLKRDGEQQPLPPKADPQIDLLSTVRAINFAIKHLGPRLVPVRRGVRRPSEHPVLGASFSESL